MLEYYSVILKDCAVKQVRCGPNLCDASDSMSHSGQDIGECFLSPARCCPGRPDNPIDVPENRVCCVRLLSMDGYVSKHSDVFSSRQTSMLKKVERRLTFDNFYTDFLTTRSRHVWEGRLLKSHSQYRTIIRNNNYCTPLLQFRSVTIRIQQS